MYKSEAMSDVERKSVQGRATAPLPAGVDGMEEATRQAVSAQREAMIEEELENVAVLGYN